jgi:hypothetical protein
MKLKMFLCLSVAVCALLMVLSTTKTVAQSTCTDNDYDGYTTCDGDCDDNDPVKVPVDEDGDGVSSCAGDCQPYEPQVNKCTHQKKFYPPEPAYYPDNCYPIREDVKEYQCTEGQSFSQCTLVSQTTNWYNSCGY